MDTSYFERQKLFLSEKLDQFLPDHKDQIIRLARPTAYLNPNQVSDQSKSHFLGFPITDQGDFILDHSSNKPHIHLATFFLSDFPNDFFPSKWKDVLSFFFRDSSEYDYLWTQPDEESFKVYNYSEENAAMIDSFYDEASDDYKPIDANPAVNFDKQLELEIAPSIILEKYLSLNGEQLKIYQSKVHGPYSLRFNSHLSFYSIRGKAEIKIGGFAVSAQEPACYDAEFIANSQPVYVDRADEFKKEVKVNMKDAIDWRLLLQIRPYKHNFGSVKLLKDAYVFYMIRQKDYEQGNFDNVQLVTQWT